MSGAGIPIGPGVRVTLHYTLTLEDGTEADTTRGGDPLVFTVGDGTMIEGMEKALYGFHAGDHQYIRLDPESTFGLRDPGNVHRLPRSDFPGEMALDRGTVVGFTTPAGDEIGGVVTEVADDEVAVDFNHPLAGHQAGFEFEVLAVE